MSTPIKKKPTAKAAEPKAKKKASYYKIAVHLSKENGELKDELQAVKERLRELNSRGEEKKDVPIQECVRTRSEVSLDRLTGELNRLDHYADFIDGKIEAVIGSSTQVSQFDDLPGNCFLDKLDRMIGRLESQNARTALQIEHLSQII